jgi:hypothetical protein
VLAAATNPLTFIDIDDITVRDMTAGEWLRLRAVELAAAGATAALLIGGLAAGVPFLLDRIPEVFLYSFCCVAAVIVHALLDLALGAGRALARRLGLSRRALPQRGYVTSVLSL